MGYLDLIFRYMDGGCSVVQEAAVNTELAISSRDTYSKSRAMQALVHILHSLMPSGPGFELHPT